MESFISFLIANRSVLSTRFQRNSGL